MRIIKILLYKVGVAFVLLQILQNNAIMAQNAEKSPPPVWHGICAAILAQTEWGVTDPEIVSAIRCHTTGKVGMLPLDMIVYLSDKIEPSRRSYPVLEEVREMAQKDLAQAMLHSLESTLAYVRSQNTTPHPLTQQVADWLKRIVKTEK